MNNLGDPRVCAFAVFAKFSKQFSAYSNPRNCIEHKQYMCNGLPMDKCKVSITGALQSEVKREPYVSNFVKSSESPTN
uniref:Uncharacterized protein n=1 Tax=Romanomermis culicivorax TaxID=13658 RepID=A0A915LB76_ROMCU